MLHLGDHNVSGSVRDDVDDASYQEIVRAMTEPFMRADLTAVVREMERRFDGSNYSLRSLFRDEQRNVLNVILAANLQEAESLYRQIYRPRAPLMRFLTDLGIPLPESFSAAADFVVNQQLRAALAPPEPDLNRAFELLESAHLEGVSLDTAVLELAYRRSLESLAQAASANPAGSDLEQFHHAMSALPRLPFSVDLWRVQNLYYRMLTEEYPRRLAAQKRGDEHARRWIELFRGIGDTLRIKIPA